MTSLDGAVVLVLGATGGLGSRIADRLEEAGAQVVRAGRRVEDPVLSADLRGEDAPARLVEHVVATAGRLDGVVVAAGVVAFGPAGSVGDETLEELFVVDTLAPIRALRAAFEPLAAAAKAGGSPFAVTISGVVAEAPTAGLAAYSAAKAGLAAFVRASSREYKRAGIRLLDARPGHTETGLGSRAIAGESPAFGAGLDPDGVAERIVRAITDGETDLPSTAF